MCECCHESSMDFFDALAMRWDGMHDLGALGVTLDAGLAKFGVRPDENVLDVGCGTGNLTAAIIRRLSSNGKVTAIDLSHVMLDVACSKVNDSRVTWVCGMVEGLDVKNESFDRIICFSVWPHLADPEMAGRIFLRMLKPGGSLHVWHTISRDAVNRIHAEASEAVHDHQLAPAAQTAAALEAIGFQIHETRDDEAAYLVSAVKGYCSGD